MDIVMFLENFHFRNEILELIVPIIMMAVDFITGSFSAWMTHTFQSARMRAGLTKKVGEMSIIVIGALLSYALRLPPQIMLTVHRGVQRRYIALYAAAEHDASLRPVAAYVHTAANRALAGD